MWTRADLKARGKAAFLSNYWRCVAAALLLSLFFTGAANTARDRGASAGRGVFDISLTETAADPAPMDLSYGDAAPVRILELIFAGTGLLFSLVTVTIAALIAVCLIGPLEVGIRRFFLMNARALDAGYGGPYLDGPAPVGLGELFHAYRYGWGNAALTLLRRDLYLLAWSLLFVIPGIVKSYSYRMVPYILAEWPEMDGSEAIELSMEMMDGQKFDTFILDLSFFLWWILSAVTGGLAHVFFVGPYRAATDAELYEDLRAQFVSEARGPGSGWSV